MKIESKETSIIHYILYDHDSDWTKFRRFGHKDCLVPSWEQLMGESWEPCYRLEKELEKHFQIAVNKPWDDEDGRN